MAVPDTRPYQRPSPDRTVWTVVDLEAIPDDGNRYEILHGELLVTPLPSTGHQRIAVRLTVLTVMWCRAHTGWTVLAPGGVHVSETTWLEPDLAVYAAQESASLSWRELPPLLVVEVLSPAARDQRPGLNSLSQGRSGAVVFQRHIRCRPQHPARGAVDESPVVRRGRVRCWEGDRVHHAAHQQAGRDRLECTRDRG